MNPELTIKIKKIIGSKVFRDLENYWHGEVQEIQINNNFLFYINFYKMELNPKQKFMDEVWEYFESNQVKN